MLFENVIFQDVHVIDIPSRSVCANKWVVIKPQRIFRDYIYLLLIIIQYNGHIVLYFIILT